VTGTVLGDRVLSAPMAERKWRGKRVGDAADAARLCVGPNRPEGVTPDTYQYYVKRLGAPGPVKGYRDPDTGRLMYDLDKVAAWHASRPGRGARTDLDRVEQ
jgi:hypothetical protein